MMSLIYAHVLKDFMKLIIHVTSVLNYVLSARLSKYALSVFKIHQSYFQISNVIVLMDIILM